MPIQFQYVNHGEKFRYRKSWWNKLSSKIAVGIETNITASIDPEAPVGIYLNTLTDSQRSHIIILT